MSAQPSAKAKEEVVARATSSSSSSSKAAKKKAKKKSDPNMLVPVFEMKFHLFREELSVVKIDKKAVSIIRCGCWGWAQYVNCLYKENLVDWDNVSSQDKREFDALSEYFEVLTKSELDRSFTRKSPQRYTPTLLLEFHSAARKWSRLMKRAKVCKQTGDACTAPVLSTDAPWRNVVIMFFKKFTDFADVRAQILDNIWRAKHPDGKEKVATKVKRRGSLPAYMRVDEDDLDASRNEEMFARYGGISTLASEEEDEEDEEEEDGAYISLDSTPIPKTKKRKSSSSSGSSLQESKRSKQNIEDRKIREARALAQSKRMEEEEDSEEQEEDPLETDDQEVDDEEAASVEEVNSAYGKSESFVQEEEDDSDSDEDEPDEHLLWQQTYKVAKNKAKKLLKDPETSSAKVTEMYHEMKRIWGDNKQMFRKNPFGEDPEDDVEDATEKWDPVWDKLYRRYNKTKPEPKSKSGRKKMVSKKAGGGSNPLNT